MSSAAAWSYTSTATLWARIGRDDRTGAVTYASPVTFACDYKAKAERMTDSTGVEFMTRQMIYTERNDIKRGDMVVIGASVEANPSTAKAFEVRSVTRFADTFENIADDFMVAT